MSANVDGLIMLDATQIGTYAMVSGQRQKDGQTAAEFFRELELNVQSLSFTTPVFLLCHFITGLNDEEVRRKLLQRYSGSAITLNNVLEYVESLEADARRECDPVQAILNKYYGRLCKYQSYAIEELGFKTLWCLSVVFVFITFSACHAVETYSKGVKARHVFMSEELYLTMAGGLAKLSYFLSVCMVCMVFYFWGASSNNSNVNRSRGLDLLLCGSATLVILISYSACHVVDVLYSNAVGEVNDFLVEEMICLIGARVLVYGCCTFAVSWVCSLSYTRYQLYASPSDGDYNENEPEE